MNTITKQLRCLLVSLVLATVSCNTDQNSLPSQIIDIVVEEGSLDANNPEYESYFNGEALPFRVETISDSLKIYLVKDSGGYFSGAGAATHWIIIQRGSTFHLAMNAQGDNFRVIRTDPEVPDIEFDYAVIRNPNPEIRHSRFKWNGERYELHEIKLIDGVPVNIPTPILVALGYTFSSTEFDMPPQDKGVLRYDRLSIVRTIGNSTGDSLFIVKQSNYDGTVTSWLFAPEPDSFRLIQQLQEEVIPWSDSNRSTFDLIGTSNTRYVWERSMYVRDSTMIKK